MFRKVLIANRGAIAVRIERTLRRMGIPSVALYTTADQDSRHVELADEAVWIGDGPAQDSYLDGERILDIAAAYGVDAIHPGYGFLSENAAFARRCQARHITFIGPTPEQIELFGQKHRAREVAMAVGAPVVPGSPLVHSVEEALLAAEAIGYPVMLKATAGGGGIGMQICDDEMALRQAFDSVGRVAETHFRDAGVFLEKYIARGRHIEVQIFGTETGEVVTLGERDCSIQRRNQKILEESPAPYLTPDLRNKMAAAAKRLAEAVHYRNAGTVEFILDATTGEFYLLEVNTRLQVEHGVTEEVLGIDLVEWMILEAAHNLCHLSDRVPKPVGHSIEVRLYAEDAGHQFRPSTGTIDAVQWPEDARVETWIQNGVTVTPYYDSMLAKIIVHGQDRPDALKKIRQALAETRVYGVTTNRSYVSALLEDPHFAEGPLYTQWLRTFAPDERALEVLDGGLQTTVQDWPGRTGYWQVGVPPSGPMDPLSFRLGNQLLGNPESAAGLELTLRGGTFQFRSDMWFCITGADFQPRLDDEPVPLFQPIQARRGQVLKFGEATEGMRSYLLVQGGFDVPRTLGSASTFTLGGFGGHGGRSLRAGDVLAVNPSPPSIPEGSVVQPPILSHQWTIGVLPGPHSTEEFLQPEYLEQLTNTTWEVHYNSSRTGVRLVGPAPRWARTDGGDAGLHPSNIHDNAYAVGTLDLTGDMPILLGPDGPSLGGFVCPVTTVAAELWKIGQLRPGDTVQFRLLTIEDAETRRRYQETYIAARGHGDYLIAAEERDSTPQLVHQPVYAIVAQTAHHPDFPMTIRLAGDENLLVEYGPMEWDIRHRFRVHVLFDALRARSDLPIVDLTPGIRSLLVHIDPGRISLTEMRGILLEFDRHLPDLDSMQVTSRIVHLPLSWDDPKAQLAVSRYQQNVRPDAPWCPSNIEFIRRINGLDSLETVKQIVYDATYLVLGLGDVYLGAPVAIPLDPRHRLITTKYNPARTWTPENAVGIGGAYLCVYGMEGPGGYQLVGRTVQMWNKWRSTRSFQSGKPWLLRFFDQIRFYPVTAEELLKLREDFLRGRFDVTIEETQFNLGRYLQYLDEIANEAEAFRKRQREAFQAERERWKALGLAEYVSDYASMPVLDEEGPVEGEPIRSGLPGSVWKVLKKVGETVNQGEELVVLESMKMEFPLTAPFDGVVASILVKPGDQVQPGQLLMGIYRR